MSHECKPFKFRTTTTSELYMFVFTRTYLQLDEVADALKIASLCVFAVASARCCFQRKVLRLFRNRNQFIAYFFRDFLVGIIIKLLILRVDIIGLVFFLLQIHVTNMKFWLTTTQFCLKY